MNEKLFDNKSNFTHYLGESVQKNSKRFENIVKKYSYQVPLSNLKYFYSYFKLTSNKRIKKLINKNLGSNIEDSFSNTSIPFDELVLLKAHYLISKEEYIFLKKFVFSSICAIFFSTLYIKSDFKKFIFLDNNRLLHNKLNTGIYFVIKLGINFSLLFSFYFFSIFLTYFCFRKLIVMDEEIFSQNN